MWLANVVVVRKVVNGNESDAEQLRLENNEGSLANLGAMGVVARVNVEVDPPKSCS